MSPGLLLQVLVSGLAAGAAYALIAIGFSVIWRMTRVLNFAHGDLVSGGTFVYLLALGGGGAVAVVGRSPAALWTGALVAVIATVLGALVVERVAVRPYLGAGAAAGWIAATAALGLLLRSLAGLGFQAESYTVPDVLGVSGHLDLPGGGIVEVRALVVLAVGLGLAVALDRWLALSRTGRAMRAAAEAPDAAMLSGAPVARLRAVAWALAGALTASAGLLVAPGRPVTLTLGVVLGLKGAAAAVLGGLGDARRAVVAGLTLGVVEAAATTYLATGLQDVIGPALLVLALALVPGWLGGREERFE